MGIGFHVEGSHVEMPGWSYGGFWVFRRRIAKEIGITLDKMVGFGDKAEQPWEPYASEPLLPLLNHSDCDGELSPSECALVAPRLSEILDRWPREGHDYDREQGRRLVAAMKEAARLGQPLIFC